MSVDLQAEERKLKMYKSLFDQMLSSDMSSYSQMSHHNKNPSRRHRDAVIMAAVAADPLL